MKRGTLPRRVLSHHAAASAGSSPARSGSAERTRQIEAEQIALLYSQGIRSQAVTMLNAAFVTLVLWRPGTRAVLAAWIVLTALIAAGRLRLARAYRGAPERDRAERRWRSYYIAATACGGMGWGFAAVYLFPIVSLPKQVFLTFVFGGMAVGAAAIMAPVLEAYWAFLAPFTVPISVQLLASADRMSIAMGVMFTACTAMFLSAARQMHTSITESIRLRFENLDLVQSLSAAKDDAESANRSLQVEVGERTRAEAELTASLSEKEALLTEIHHRVKNNLQVISSLLSLQSRRLTNPEAISVFTQSQSRVRSMALVHEKLYQSPDLARIDFAAYIRELASYLCRVYQTSPDAVPVRVDAKGVFLTIERAVPCGLIVTELLSNALKYAFPRGGPGEIGIELRPEEGGFYRMTIRDDGIGLPEHVDVRRPQSLGLRIVNTLTEQLGGSIAVSSHGGTEFTLAFPIEEDHGAAEGRPHPHPDR